MAKEFRRSFTKTINGSEVRIDNYFNSYNYGFSHTSKLYIDGVNVSSAVVGYINRTWECYSYQTSAIKAVDCAIDDRIETRKGYYKNNNNIARMTKKHNENLAAELKTDSRLVLLNKIKAVLKQGGCYGPLKMKVFYA